jgi:hypothetical protein
MPILIFLLGLALCAPASPAIGGLFAAGGGQAEAKKDYALIFGTVWGKDYHPVQGVKVKIRRADEKKARWEVYSDRRGEFAQRVPVGQAEYVIWADVKVPKGQQKPQVTVKVENNERVDTGLHLTE